MKYRLFDNEYWFIPKRFGWGYIPVTLEGWIAVLALLAGYCISAYINGLFNCSGDVSTQHGLSFLLDAVIISFVFHLFCRSKVKGKITWNWGFKRKNETKINKE